MIPLLAPRRRGFSTHEGLLKADLILLERTAARTEDGSKMIESLQQREGVGRVRGRRFFAAQRDAHGVQTPTQSTACAAKAFQGHGQPLGRRLQGSPGQKLGEHLPEQRRCQRMARKKTAQKKRDTSPAARTPAPIGTIGPLAAKRGARRASQIVAAQLAMAIERACLPAMRTAALLQVKAAGSRAPENPERKYKARFASPALKPAASRKSSFKCMAPHGTGGAFYGATRSTGNELSLKLRH